MALALGYKGAIGFEMETTYGTAVAPATWIDFMQAQFQNGYTKQLIDTINQSAAFKKEVSLGQDVKGSITFPVNPDDFIGQLLKVFMGQSPTSAQQGTSTAYQHTFLGASNLIADGTKGCGLTGQVIYDTTAIDYKGLIPSTIEFSIAPNGLLMCTANFDGQQAATNGSPGTPSYSANNPFLFQQGVVTKDGSSISVVNAKIKLDNRLDASTYLLGQTYIKRPAPGGRHITGEVEMYFEDTGIYTDFTANTNRAMVLTFTGPVISGSYNYALTFNLAQVYFFNNPTPKFNGKKPITYVAPFEAIWSGSTNQDIKIQLTNTTTSY